MYGFEIVIVNVLVTFIFIALVIIMLNWILIFNTFIIIFLCLISLFNSYMHSENNDCTLFNLVL